MSIISLYSHSSVSLVLRRTFRLAFWLMLSPLMAQSFEGFRYSSDGTTITITDYRGDAGRAVTIPETIDGLPVRAIGNRAFSGNTILTSVTIPDSVTSIGDQAFHVCGSLTSVTIGNGVTSIGFMAFRDCTSLTGVTLPDSVTSIGDSAFSGCRGLTSVTIPNNVTSIGSGPFSYCTGLLNIEVVAGNTTYRGVEGVLFNSSRSSLIQYPAGKPKDYIIPDTVVSIEDFAFAASAGLISVAIPESVTSIGEFAFNGCRGLTSVTIPKSVTSLGVSAFRYCASLLSIEVAAANAAYTDQDGVLFTRDLTSLIQFPNGRTGSYTIPDSVISIGTSAFASNSELTKVTFPKRLTSIGERAFEGCRGLTSVTIPENVTTLGEWGFLDCQGLISVTIPENVTILEKGTFFGCTGLTHVTLPNNVTAIGDSAFSGCTGLAGIALPNSVTSIGTYAFNGCTGLTRVTIPESIIFIKSLVFYECTGLTSAIFKGNAPVSFGSLVFYGTAPGFTVYYYQGRTGFTSPKWQGYPAVALDVPVDPSLEDWRRQHFGEGAINAGEAADAADPDGDGFTNAEEYAAGTDPKSMASVLEVQSATKTDTTYTVTFDAQPNRRYELLRRLVTPGATWLPVATLEPPAAAGLVSLIDTEAPADAALYRVLVSIP